MTDFLPGWPCTINDTTAPAIDDRLSAPTADTLLPQLLALTPRGPAWGTDEAGDGNGSSPLMLKFWRAIAGWMAANYAIDFTLAAQALPSLISWSLADWEAELGLPDPCIGPLAGNAARIAAVRARYAGLGGQSPNFYICLGRSLGFQVCRIEEFAACRVGAKCGDQIWGANAEACWRVHADPVAVSYARCGSARAGDKLASWGNALLECAISRVAPAHTIAIFAYDCDAFLLGDDETPLVADDGTTFLTPG